MKIKKNDKVKILIGKDVGKIGKILNVSPKTVSGKKRSPHYIA